MLMFATQVVLSIALAFGLGCLFGCRLRRRFPAQHGRPGVAAAPDELEGTSRRSEPAISEEASFATPAAPDEDAGEPVPTAANPGAVESGTASEPGRKPAKAKAVRSKSEKRPAAAKVAKPRSNRASVSAAKAKPGKGPAVKPKPAKAAGGAGGGPDNLKQIKGVGPVIEAKLNAAGIHSFAQIAAWTQKEQAAFGEQLSFPGRIEREEWVRQAKVLASDETTDFSRRVAEGSVASSATPKPKSAD